MADDKEVQEQEEKKSGGGLLPLINLVLLVLLLGVGGFIAWELLQLKQQQAAPPAAQATKSEDAAIPEAEDDSGAPPVLMDLDNITVNLADTDASRFLRAKIKLAVRGEEAKAKIEANKAKIDDLIITVLSSKKFADIRTPQGKYALKEELVYRINRAVGGKPVKTLYFTDFVAQ